MNRKRNRKWFERKVGELGAAIRKLPEPRQLELFRELDKPRAAETCENSGNQGVSGYGPLPDRAV